MPFAALDTAAIARALSQLAEQPADLVDVFLERSEEIQLPPEGVAPGLQARREEGFALRLVRDGRTWIASRDGITSRDFADALRQVARVLPAAPYPPPDLQLTPWQEPPGAPELLEFPLAVERALRAHHVAFPVPLRACRHRRWTQVIGAQLVAPAQSERFYSLEAELPWGRLGTLLPELDETGAEQIAELLLEGFRARSANVPEAPLRGPVVLGPDAAAVLVHEAVAHALEADTLALGGKPEAALGVGLAQPELHVLDDPTSAPEPVRRSCDDEGMTTGRRWLLRGGVVEQPLADSFWARATEALAPGAGRRSDRHQAPAPRCHHLEVLAGEQSPEELLAEADGGLYVAQAEQGQLDPLTGEFVLTLPFARRIRGGEIADAIGRCRLRGQVGDLLTSIRGIGNRTRPAGAGWCAKGGMKLPVWATTPDLLLENTEVGP